MLIVLTAAPRPAFADGITMSAELNYSYQKSVSTDSGSLTTETKGSNFVQRYNLLLEKTIYPNLKLRVGGLFDKNISDVKTGDADIKSDLTKISPFADITLSTPFITAGAGFNRLQERQKAGDTSPLTTFRDNYNVIFGLRPVGLPNLDTFFTRTETYDKRRLMTDRIDDHFSASTQYTPVKNLDLRYQFTSNDSKDFLNMLEVISTTQTGRATYSRQFFGNRVSVFGSYNITSQSTETSAKGAGEVDFQLFPFAGLSLITDVLLLDTLNQNPAIIDGNLTAGSGVNIGVPPTGGDVRPRNIGLDFFNLTEVNTLYVWVDRPLPSGISNYYSWGIYTSTDNQNWTLHTTIAPAPFGAFENRFELSFPNVSTRYVKVVVSPLTVAAAALEPTFQNPDTIPVTEMQAFLRRPAQSVRGKTTSTTSIYDFNVRTRLLDIPLIYYDFYYWHTKTSPGGIPRYILSNALSLNHTFSSVISASARVSREDSKEITGNRAAYVYSASVTAIPLPTLRHNLVFSGQNSETSGKPADTQSLFLTNSAELYRGITANLSSGLSNSKSETGQKTSSSILNAGLNLVPNPKMNINITYSGTSTKTSSGAAANSTTSTRNAVFAISYTPFSTLFIFSSLSMVSGSSQKTNLTQNYAVTWTPFRDGALQVGIAYNETITSENQGKDRIFTPSLRWNITRRSYLDVSYLVLKSDSSSQSSDARIISTSLKIFL